MSAPIRILNVGSGALGAFYSSRLASISSVELYCVCRSNYDHVKKKGFFINSNTYGNYNFEAKQVFNSIDEASISGLVFDYCLVTTKCLPDQIKVETLIAPIVSKETIIVLIQNGIDIEKPYKAQFPENSLISCIASVGVTQKDTGKIYHLMGGHLAVGLFLDKKLSDPTQHPHLTEFTELLKKAIVPFDITSDIEFSRWKKLVWNGSFSPICILAGGCNTKEILENKETRKLLTATMEEIIQLALKVNTDLSPDCPPFYTAEKYIELTSGPGYKPSLLIDYERKNPLELEATLGNMLRIAKKIGHPVPLTETFYSLLKLADFKSRGLFEVC